MDSKKVSPPRVLRRRMIVWPLAVMLACGGVCLLCYLWWNYNSIRANFVAARAKGRVEQIYTRTREAAPDGVTLIGEEKPDSGTYALALSDGAPRYARVRAQQTYVTSTAFNKISATYKTAFKKWGWIAVPLDNDEAIWFSMVFRHPSDKDLLVGLCSPVNTYHPTVPIQYTIFFDFDEAGCEGPRLYCIAGRYCK